MAVLRQRLMTGKEELNVGSIERYERLAQLVIDNSANVLTSDPEEPYFQVPPSVQEIEPELVEVTYFIVLKFISFVIEMLINIAHVIIVHCRYLSYILVCCYILPLPFH